MNTWMRLFVSSTAVLIFWGIALNAQSPDAPGTGGAGSSSASAARLVKFSGTLRDGSRAPLTGTVGVTIAIYKEQQGGTPLWMETQNVSLDAQGNYSVLLGATQSDGLPLELFSSGESRWLGVQAQLPGELEQPRVLLVSVPYALKAADAETLGGKPLSAFVLAAPANDFGDASSSTLENGNGKLKQITSKAAVTGAAIQSASYLAQFDPACTKGCGSLLVNSPLFASGGNVGIGTIIPAQALDVNGSAKIANNLTIGGNINATGSITAASFSGNGSALSGVGTITAVNTAASSGLSGGVTSGAANLALTAAARTRVITYLGGCDTCSVLADADSQHMIYDDLIGNMTINSVTCFSDGGTPKINIARNGTNIIGSSPTIPADLTCSTAGATSAAILTAQNAMSLNDKLDFVMVTAGGTAKRVTVSIVATLN